MRVGKVGLRHGDALLVIGGQLQAVEQDIEVAALQGGNELVPLVLDHPGLYAQFRGQGLGQLVFEPDELLGLLRIRIDIGSSALGVGAPEQHAALFDLVQVVGGKESSGSTGEHGQGQEAVK